MSNVDYKTGSDFFFLFSIHFTLRCNIANIPMSIFLCFCEYVCVCVCSSFVFLSHWVCCFARRLMARMVILFCVCFLPPAYACIHVSSIHFVLFCLYPSFGIFTNITQFNDHSYHVNGCIVVIGAVILLPITHYCHTLYSYLIILLWIDFLCLCVCVCVFECLCVYAYNLVLPFISIYVIIFNLFFLHFFFFFSLAPFSFGRGCRNFYDHVIFPPFSSLHWFYIVMFMCFVILQFFSICHSFEIS